MVFHFGSLRIAIVNDFTGRINQRDSQVGTSKPCQILRLAFERFVNVGSFDQPQVFTQVDLELVRHFVFEDSHRKKYSQEGGNDTHINQAVSYTVFHCALYPTLRIV